MRTVEVQIHAQISNRYWDSQNLFIRYLVLAQLQEQLFCGLCVQIFDPTFQTLLVTILT